MGILRNWKYELFARQVAEGAEPRDAYTGAGYKYNRANHNKLLRRPEIAARIEELRRARQEAAAAARMSPENIVQSLSSCGLDRLADFFERDEAGILRVRDLQTVPVEVTLALIRELRAGFCIPADIVI